MPTLENRITGAEFAERLRPFGELPVVMHVVWDDGSDEFELDSGQTDFDGKPGTETDYGCIDVIRIALDHDKEKSGSPLTAAAISATLKGNVPVKFRIGETDVSFLLGSDMQISRRREGDEEKCLVTVLDTDDA